MAYCRGNRGINLYPNDEDLDKSIDDEDTRTKISVEAFNEKREKWEVIGLQGEELVVEIERRRLIELGRVDLADAVRHVKLYDCSAGYDILSYELDGRSRFIECKTSVGSSMKFEITSNE